MDKNIFNRIPRMRHSKLYDADREQVAKEIAESDTMIAFYRTKDGDNRCVFTGFCLDMFMFLIVILSRNIIVYDFFKKVIETVEKCRESLDPNSHVLEAVEYLKLHIQKDKSDELY